MAASGARATMGRPGPGRFAVSCARAKYSEGVPMRRTLIPFLLGGLAACGTSSTKSDGGAADLTTACDPANYPCGPFGTGAGSVIDNVQLMVKSDANKDGIIDAKDVAKSTRLADYFKNKQYTVLFIDTAAGWCGPCKAEQPGLVKMFADYGGRAGKVAFLEAVIEKSDRSLSDEPYVDNWATLYKIPFDMAYDPDGVLEPYYNKSSFPTQIVISTKDMKIVWQMNGAQLSDVKAAIDKVM
ncbi:MAG: TlpA family protein disulfide reductase [Myxococcales bacterium]|nr:TlpA family protein disulfide reductase [Myxococcales bacterium]